MSWDPALYQRYADERGRPFDDLLTRIDCAAPESVVDLGCGPGDRTATLLKRWPGAYVVGIDSSAEMIGSAAAHAVPGRLDFRQADLRDWRPDTAIDVVVSNATLQWVPDHLELLPALVGWLAPGGWLGFQVPGNFDQPSHVLLDELRNSARWRDRVGPGTSAARTASVADPATYLSVLSALGLVVDAWETTYLHVLPGDDAVLEWTRGTALRPVLAVLEGAERADFLAEYAAVLATAYPRQEFGTVLPFRRIFVAARAAGAARRTVAAKR